MDFQLITGGPDTTDYLAFTTTFTHNNVFYKAALAETISWEGHLTGTASVGQRHSTPHPHKRWSALESGR